MIFKIFKPKREANGLKNKYCVKIQKKDNESFYALRYEEILHDILKLNGLPDILENSETLSYLMEWPKYISDLKNWVRFDSAEEAKIFIEKLESILVMKKLL